MNTTSYPRSISGFTLIETITALSIACILLATGIPSFRSIIQNNRMYAAINSITVNLNLARSEAVKRNTSVVLCPSADGFSCENTMIWDQGTIMFTDDNKSGQFEQGEELLRYNNISSGSILISTTIGRRKAVYDAYGFSQGKNVTFTFCDTDNQVDPKTVIVSNSGRVRLSNTNYNGSLPNCN